MGIVLSYYGRISNNLRQLLIIESIIVIITLKVDLEEF